jgi:hypothetical protein
MQQQLGKTKAGDDRITISPPPEISEPRNREQIAALAYEFWLARGCPQGTPDEDWFRAEREIDGSRGIDENERGSRDAAELSIDAKVADSDLPVLRFPVRSEVFQAPPVRMRMLA